MAGLVPAIHVFVLERLSDVDARDKRRHDESAFLKLGVIPTAVDSDSLRIPGQLGT
jgi:hypothetical protein